jgi:hypothetical protein
MFILTNYVNSIFEKLPQNLKMVKLKQEILSNMGERYVQLLTEQVNQQQAIAQVLAELGNIDDYLIKKNSSSEEFDFEKNILHWSKDETETFKNHRSTFSLASAIGVFLIFIAPVFALLIQKSAPYLPLLSGLSSSQLILFSLIPVLILMAVGIGLFVHFGIKELAFGIGEKVISLDSMTRASLIQEKKEFKQPFIKGMTSGILFCVAGLVFLLWPLLFAQFDPFWSLIFILSFMAIGTFLFTFFNMIQVTYDKLLSTGHYSPRKSASERLTTKVAHLIFLPAIAIYVISGLLFQIWSLGWLIFPILGIAFGVFAILVENPHLFKRKK